MDTVLDALGELLLKALPTFILLVLLHFYLKWVFYRPMDGVLRQRWEATEGARKAADESLARAEQKAAEYGDALRKARAELRREHEEASQRWLGDQAAALGEMRRKTQTMVAEAKARIAEETAAAKRGLEAESEALAEEIVGALLERKAS